jgi:hypothetical protein
MILENIWYIGYVVIICCLIYISMLIYNYINHKYCNIDDDNNNDFINNDLKILSKLNRKNNKIIININGSHYYY